MKCMVTHHSLKGFWHTASRVDRYCASTNSGDSSKKSSSLWCVTCTALYLSSEAFANEISAKQKIMGAKGEPW
jgi:hypothetical protein